MMVLDREAVRYRRALRRTSPNRSMRKEQSPGWDCQLLPVGEDGRCLLWVISDSRGGSHTPMHVRFAPKADK
jgi:hypothetical protein